MTNRREFLIRGASAAVVPLVVPSIALAKLPPVTIAPPPVFNHAQTDAFCGVQEINDVWDWWFRLRTKYYKPTDANYPPMAFVIEKEPLATGVMVENPIYWFRQLKQIEIKDNRFDLARLSNQIAMRSRRGCGNTLLYNYELSFPPDWVDEYYPKIRKVNFNQLEKNEYVILYNGPNRFDASIYKIMLRDSGACAYTTNYRWSSYAIRFKFGNKAFDSDDLPKWEPQYLNGNGNECWYPS